MKIKIKELEELVRKVLQTKYSSDEVELMLPVIMFAELSVTKSHGIVRVPAIVNKKPISKPEVKEKTKVSNIIDGNGNPGMLVGGIACNEVMSLAKEFGIGIVGTRGSVSSSGCLSYYVEKIAKEDLIAVVMARAPGDVAPYKGLERLFGTNPIAFGIPADKGPLIFDMATSAISWGAVDNARRNKQLLPDMVAVDEDGIMTNDPQEALDGAFLTFDNSYKGYGLAMMIEILAGVLPGADFLDLGEGDEWGNLFLAIDPKTLSSLDEFKTKVRLMIEKVRKSKSIDGKDIRIPGEKRLLLRDNFVNRGIISVDEKVFEEINRLEKHNNK